jgi:carbon storage regulator CsrA
MKDRTALTLTRRVGQAVVIRCGRAVIEVRVRAIDGREARLRIEAPQGVAVNREEIDRKKYPEETAQVTNQDILEISSTLPLL